MAFQLLLITGSGWRTVNVLGAHLNPGGIAYYNTTGSPRALITGATEFPYALRVSGFLAVSDTPFALNRPRWETALTNSSMEGRPIFDLADPAQQARLESVLSLAGETGRKRGLIESRASLLHRLRAFQPITDNNMGTEWQ